MIKNFMIFEGAAAAVRPTAEFFYRTPQRQVKEVLSSVINLSWKKKNKSKLTQQNSHKKKEKQ